MMAAPFPFGGESDGEGLPCGLVSPPGSAITPTVMIWTGRSINDTSIRKSHKFGFLLRVMVVAYGTLDLE
jgi:hypothetical protein